MGEFLLQLQRFLTPKIQMILQHPFIAALEERRLTTDQVREFAIQYGIYCECFPRCLAAVAAAIPDDKTRLPIIENLWEEHGEGNLSKSHRMLFAQFLRPLELEMNEETISRAFPSTLDYVRELTEMCRNESFLVGLGAMGPGTESFTSAEYTKILNGLRGYDEFSDADLRFWSEHVEVDDDHSSAILRALEPWTTSKDNRAQIQRGAMRALELELMFWEGIGSTVSPGSSFYA